MLQKINTEQVKLQSGIHRHFVGFLMGTLNTGTGHFCSRKFLGNAGCLILLLKKQYGMSTGTRAVIHEP